MHPSLRERSLGDWEGRSKEELRKEAPHAFLSSGNLDPRFTPPNGEPLDALVSRVKRFLDQIQDVEENESVVAVTHNGVIRVIHHLLEHTPIEVAFLPNVHFLEPSSYHLKCKQRPILVVADANQ